MKPRCILHIGMPKTGSSSIQTTLFREKIIKGCEYLNIGSEGNHSTIIYSLFSKKPDLHHAHIAANRSKEQIEEFIKYYREQLVKTLVSIRSKQYIISGEDILFLEEDELLQMKRTLMQFSSEIHVIAYVRPPISFMQSAFQQNVKEGDIRFGIADYYPEYRNRFEKFDRVFGQENVFLNKFDVDSLFEGDVVSDFTNKIGISISKEKITRVNESISLEAIALLYVFYKFGRSGDCLVGGKNHKLVHDLSKFGVRKFKYSKVLSDHIRTILADDIHWMENRLKCTLAESTSGNGDGVSSEKDLIEIAFVNRDKLSELISQKIMQQMISPQNIADILAFLSGNYFIKPSFSHKQLSRLESPKIELGDMLRELVLSLGRAGQIKAVQNTLENISNFKNLFNNPSIYVCNISFSVDMYHNGCLMGWIVDKNNPLNKLHIEFRLEKQVIAQGVANKFRQDLADAEIGDGCCAFVIKVNIDLKNNYGKLILRVVDFQQEFEFDIHTVKGIT